MLKNFNISLPNIPKPNTGTVQSTVIKPGATAIKPGAVDVTRNPINQYANIGARGISAATDYDAQGRPTRNDYASILGSDGRVQNQFSLANQLSPQVQLGTLGFGEIKNRALGTGESSWAQLARNQQQMEQNNLLQDAQRGAMQAQNSAFNQMRMRGGLSSGQRERLALMNQRNMMNQTQNVRNQGAQARGNILLQDQNMKNDFLKMLPQLELQQAQWQQGQRQYGDAAKQFDLQNALRDISGLNAYNSNAYQEAMREWGAQKTADAQSRAANSSPGGLLGGGIIPGIL